MKICYIADAPSILTHRWVKYFTNKGYEVHLISREPLRDNNIGGITKLYILKKFGPQIRVASFPSNLLSQTIQVRRLIREINPDILHAQYITDNGLLGVLSGFHPLVLSAWGSDILIDLKRYPLLKILTKYALWKADLVTCDSETLKKGVLELGTSVSKIKIVYDGIDTGQFNPQKRDEGLKSRLGISGAPTVICIRRLRPVYNVEMLIKAIPAILKPIPEAKFIIGGDGELREYLQGLAGSLGVSSSIRFVGRIPHNELPEYLASSDVYVSTSLSDSTSVSLQEAMACELAPVVTSLPANREWVTHEENGFIVPVGDSETLANKIEYLLTNAKVRDKFGKTCRKIITERAEHWKEMEKMGKMYKDLIESNKSDR